MRKINFTSLLLLIVGLAAVGQITNTIYVPAMNLIAKDLHVLPTKIQLIMAAYLMSYGVSQFFYGPISDRMGRKPIIIIGLLIFIIGSILNVFATTFNHLFVGSFIQGLGIGVGGVMSRTLIRDVYVGKKLHIAASYTSAALIFAPLAAPLLGGILTSAFNWRANFTFLLIFGAFILLCQIMFLPETADKSSTDTKLFSQIKSNYKQVLSNAQFNGFVICLLVVFSGVSVFEACGGILFTEILKLSPKDASLLFIIPLFPYLIGSYLSGKLHLYFSQEKLLLIGISILSSSAFIMLLIALMGFLNIISIILPVSFYMLGAGFIFPAATAKALEPFGKIAGTAGALLGGIQNLGAGICTFISGNFIQHSQLPLAIILSILSILVIITFIFLINPKK